MTNEQTDPGVIPVTELRDRLSAVIDDLPAHGRAIRLTRHGQPVAVLMDYAAFEALLQDLDDSDNIPWELAARDLGVA